jgi:hypothetical protein
MAAQRLASGMAYPMGPNSMGHWLDIAYSLELALQHRGLTAVPPADPQATLQNLSTELRNTM